jgi:hypothetical protein
MSQIYDRLVVKEDNTIVTVNKDGRNIIVVYDTEETFEKRFGLYNLREFLGSISLFDPEKTDFKFTNDRVIIKDGSKKIHYGYVNPKIIEINRFIKPSELYKKFDKFDSFFELSKEDISNITKSASILFGGYIEHAEVSVVTGPNENLLVVNCEESGRTNNFQLKLNGATGTSSAKFLVRQMMFYPGDYKVSVSKKLVKFEHKEIPLFYMLTLLPPN